MKSDNRKALAFCMGLALALAGVGVMRAGAMPEQRDSAEPHRIVPLAVPAELAPCAMSSCW